MENLPETFFVDPTTTPPPMPVSASAATSVSGETSSSSSVSQSATVAELLQMLHKPDLREQAMDLLNKKRESCAELPILLWTSYKTVFILLQEVTSVYRMLSPLRITPNQSNRVCNALALIQTMAACPETRMAIVRAKIPAYLFPFLEPMENEWPMEFLRLTSLGAIGALVKVEDSNAPEIIHSLLESEVFPLCLRCIDRGDDLSQIVSTLILMKILMQDEGLNYCCASAERFFSVLQVLGRQMERLPERPSLRLVKYIIQCYLRLAELLNTPLRSRAIETFKRCLPTKLSDERFLNYLNEDPQGTRMLQQFFLNLSSSGF